LQPPSAAHQRRLDLDELERQMAGLLINLFRQAPMFRRGTAEKCERQRDISGVLLERDIIDGAADHVGISSATIESGTSLLTAPFLTQRKRIFRSPVLTPQKQSFSCALSAVSPMASVSQQAHFTTVGSETN
jgi:hypothetical protein